MFKLIKFYQNEQLYNLKTITYLKLFPEIQVKDTPTNVKWTDKIFLCKLAVSKTKCQSKTDISGIQIVWYNG